MSKEEKLKELYENSPESKTCHALDISKGRNFVCDLGHGNPDTDIYFCGEAPGAEEDKQGIPFVGQAGKNLDENLKSIGLTRKDVWIGNVVRFRPTKNKGRSNRKPTVEEIKACLPLLKKEIEIIAPKIIITLGLVPLNALTGKSHSMAKVAGKIIKHGSMLIFPMYHPASVLYNEELEEKIAMDFIKLKEVLKEIS